MFWNVPRPASHETVVVQSELSRLEFGASLAQQDTTLGSRHPSMKDFQEHALNGSLLETGHVAPPGMF